MTDRGYLTLSEAVCSALETYGEVALLRPAMLLGFLMDCMDPDSVEMRALEHFADSHLFGPYADALASPALDLRLASERARMYLMDECWPSFASLPLALS